jgi:hypothetical protein
MHSTRTRLFASFINDDRKSMRKVVSLPFHGYSSAGLLSRLLLCYALLASSHTSHLIFYPVHYCHFIYSLMLMSNLNPPTTAGPRKGCICELSHRYCDRITCSDALARRFEGLRDLKPCRRVRVIIYLCLSVDSYTPLLPSLKPPSFSPTKPLNATPEPHPFNTTFNHTHTPSPPPHQYQHQHTPPHLLLHLDRIHPSSPLP